LNRLEVSAQVGLEVCDSDALHEGIVVARRSCSEAGDPARPAIFGTSEIAVIPGGGLASRMDGTRLGPSHARRGLRHGSSLKSDVF
jgi:hypothetical protein